MELNNEVQELKEKLLHLTELQKLLKVVELFRFSAVVVAGDGNGHIGVGNGKASEVPDGY